MSRAPTHPPNKVRPYSNFSTLYIYISMSVPVCRYVLVCPKCPPSGRDRRRGMALAPPNLSLVCPCWYRRCCPQSYGHIALCGVLPYRGPGLRLLRTQPHSCRRCCSVWMAWHAAVYATSTSGSLWPHCTLCYVICRASHASFGGVAPAALPNLYSTPI